MTCCPMRRKGVRIPWLGSGEMKIGQIELLVRRRVIPVMAGPPIYQRIVAEDVVGLGPFLGAE